MNLDGAEVRWARERLGYNMEMFAEKAEIAKNSVLRAEHGEDIRPSTARKIARALGVEVSALYPKAEASRSSILSMGFTEGDLQRRVQEFLVRHPSDTPRISRVESAAGALEGYARRWVTDLNRHVEAETFPYGMALEAGVFYDRILENMLVHGLTAYAGWASKGGDGGISEREQAAATRLIDAIKNAEGTIQHVQAVEEALLTEDFQDADAAFPELRATAGDVG